MKLIYDKSKGKTVLDGFSISPERQEILLDYIMKVVNNDLKKDADMGEMVCKVIEVAETTEEAIAITIGFLNYCHTVGTIEKYNPSEPVNPE